MPHVIQDGLKEGNQEDFLVPFTEENMRRGSWVAVALLLLSGLGAPVSVPLGKGVTTTLPAVTAFQGGKPMVVLPLEWFPMALGPVEIPIPKAELSIIIE